MDLQQLFTIVRKALVVGSFQISGQAQLESASIGGLFKDFLSRDSLALANAREVGSTASVIVIEGDLTADALAAIANPVIRAILALSNHHVQAAFTSAASQAEVAITVKIADSSWHPAKTFPDLDISVFTKLSYSGAAFVLDSQTARSSLPASFEADQGYTPLPAAALGDLLKGLRFEATVGLGGLAALGQPFLHWLLGEQPLEIEGPIELYQGKTPRLRLQTGPGFPWKIGGFEIELTWKLLSVLVEDPRRRGAFDAVPFAELSAEVKKGNATLDLSTSLVSENLTLLGFDAAVKEGGHELSPGDVASFLALSQVFPSAQEVTDVLQPLGVLHGLHLAGIDLTVDVVTREFVGAGTTVKLDGTVDAFDGLLRFHDLLVRFAAVNGQHGKPFLETAAYGEVDLCGGTLEAQLTLPELAMGCSLKPGTTLDLTGLVADLGLISQLDVPQLTCTAFGIGGNVPEKTYAFEATLESAWSFGVGTADLKLTSLTLFFSHDGTSKSSTGGMLGAFQVGSIAFEVGAGYDTTCKGWSFSGTAENLVPPADLVTALQTAFSAGLDIHLPSALTQVTVKDLEVTYNTFSKEFTFTSLADFGHAAEVALDLAVLSQQDKTFEHRAQGRLTFHPGTPQQLDFELLLDSKSGNENFVAVYGSQSPTSGLDLGSLIAAVTGDAAGVAVPLAVKDALFAHGGGKSLFAIDMGAGINLSALGDLPLVGPALSGLATLQLAFQITYATADYTQPELAALNQLLPAGGPVFPAAVDPKKAGLLVQIRQGGGPPIILALPVALDPSQNGKLQEGAAPPQTGAPPPTTKDGTQWFAIQKAFGPVKIERLGLKAAGGTLTGLIDGAVAAFGLEVDLLGLAMTVDLTHGLDFDPKFSLDGLGLSFRQGPVTLAGALFRNTDVVFPEFDGLAVLRTETLGLSAIGSFAQLAGDVPSLFVYATLDAPLGGPPFFYVTGLAAGFGYNRSLTVPPVGQLSAFPLVANAVTPPPPPPTDAGGARDYLSQQLAALGDAVAPRQGEYFLAAGVAFTSFRLLQSFALLLVAFGERFEVDLVGLSTLTVPPDLGEGEAPLAEAQLALRVRVVPEEGTVLAQAQLTSASYILSRDCHLSGGYALAAWLPPSPQAGDFVVTLGGYHPRFAVPTHYPQVPRLGLQWQVNDHLSITGGLYYALVPHVFMAGGALSAVWEDGDFRAWFDAGADFLIDWKPFQYSADAYVDIGAEVTLHVFGTHHVSFDAGADLEMWGPPFGGHAHVQVKVIGVKVHFDVGFGATKPDKGPIGWPEFQTTFLPAPEEMVSSGVEAGLVRKIKHGTDAMRYVVNPRQLALAIHSAIPIKNLDTATQVQGNLGAASTSFGIAPMGKAASPVVTTLKVDVTRDGKPAGSGFQLTPILKSVPAGLWGTQAAAEVNSAQSLIANTASGLRLVPANLPKPGSTRGLDRQSLAYEPKKISSAWSFLAAAAFTGSPGAWASVDGEIVHNATRDEVLAALGLERELVTFGQPFQRDSLYPPRTGDLNS
jgi:hypothetical protein